MYQALFCSREQDEQCPYSSRRHSKQQQQQNQLVLEPYNISTVLIKLLTFHVHNLNYLLFLKLLKIRILFFHEANASTLFLCIRSTLKLCFHIIGDF